MAAHASGGRRAVGRVLGAAGVVTLLVAAAWQRLLLKGLVPIDGYTMTFAYPTWRALRRSLADGIAPLWNPHRNLGEPFLADPQSMAAYPVSWLLAPVNDYHVHVVAWVLLHTALAACFMAWAAWSRERDGWAAAAAGLVGGLNGFLVARLTFANHFAAAAWLPVALAFQLRRSPVGVGIALALQWLAGFPPFSLLTVVALAMLAVSQGRRGLRCLAEGGLWALGLASIQLVPFLELMSHSTRPGLLPPELATELSQSPAALVHQLFVPQWLGEGARLAGDPAILGFYVGVAALPLFVLAVWRGGHPARWVATACLTALGLSLGGSLPGYDMLTPLHVFRFPANWGLLASAGLALLAATGVRALPTARWKLGAVAVLALDLGLLGLHSNVSWAPESFLSDPPRIADAADVPLAPLRIHHDQALIDLWGRSLLVDESDYLTMIEFAAPSYGMAFGLQDTTSPQTLGLRLAREYRRGIPSDPRRLDWAGASLVVTLAKPAERLERENLRVLRNARALPRVFATDQTSGEVRIVGYQPGRVEAEIRAERPLRLVFSEIDHPGWRVSIDDEPVPHDRFEDAFVALDVPPGAHRVVFSFEPTSVALGGSVTVVALTLLAVRSAMRRRRAGAP